MNKMDQEIKMAGIIQVPLPYLLVAPENPRAQETLDDELINELADSINAWIEEVLAEKS